MNMFDAAVYLCLCVAIVTGFRAGLLRSMATIVGYLAAMPAAVAAAPYLVTLGNDKLQLSAGGNWIAIFVVFLAFGFILSALLARRHQRDHRPRCQHAGSRGRRDARRIARRSAGGADGADLRPHHPGQSPAAFLVTSHLRPILSVAGQQGVKKLPPEVAAYIDRLKQERGI